MANKVVSLKVPAETHETWKAQARAQGMSFNSWAISALNDQVSLDAALERERLAAQVERAKIVKKAKPQASSDCDTPSGVYCYKHDTRHA